ncbi:hypothetical protein MPTK1_7g01670 [Marchantia polymorpha subsp. ruderalis]|uniref:Uncharacterized protein n=2 Tax=Marchantia polymorpha TaxID=3197 RepID=A0AAF6BV42_MARPO|nr:hypothetical protein MARPO_0099s0040 [Marchantia polymorpha]BBN15876.1 hypothetical protein Mp_7g01670 [Marchantia polymorpha subsp. ruderalis]|eukprot:PTQ32404.1 hypothetical protein MARPO_0099s0040 [Marchantia polymorpha]
MPITTKSLTSSGWVTRRLRSPTGPHRPSGAETGRRAKTPKLERKRSELQREMNGRSLRPKFRAKDFLLKKKSAKGRALFFFGHCLQCRRCRLELSLPSAPNLLQSAFCVLDVILMCVLEHLPCPEALFLAETRGAAKHCASDNSKLASDEIHVLILILVSCFRNLS